MSGLAASAKYKPISNIARNMRQSIRQRSQRVMSAILNWLNTTVKPSLESYRFLSQPVSRVETLKPSPGSQATGPVIGDKMIVDERPERRLPRLYHLGGVRVQEQLKNT